MGSTSGSRGTRYESYSFGGVFRERGPRFFDSPSFFGLRVRFGFGSAEAGPSASTTTSATGRGAGGGAGDGSSTGLNATAGVSSAISSE